MKIPERTTKESRIPIIGLTLALVLGLSCGKGGPAAGAPKNEAAKVRIGKAAISVRYDGGDIFAGQIRAGEAGFEVT
ncbi:MAG: hypothetical protein WCC00_06095, partial [Candidatus Aminicenantales bacterium]